MQTKQAQVQDRVVPLHHVDTTRRPLSARGKSQSGVALPNMRDRGVSARPTVKRSVTSLPSIPSKHGLIPSRPKASWEHLPTIVKRSAMSLKVQEDMQALRLDEIKRADPANMPALMMNTNSMRQVLRFTQDHFAAYYQSFLDNHTFSEERMCLFSPSRSGLEGFKSLIYYGLRKKLHAMHLTPKETEYMNEAIPRDVITVRFNQAYFQAYIREHADQPVIVCDLGDTEYQVSLTRKHLLDMCRGVSFFLGRENKKIVAQAHTSTPSAAIVARAIFSCMEIGIALSQTRIQFDATGIQGREVQELNASAFLPNARNVPHSILPSLH